MTTTTKTLRMYIAYWRKHPWLLAGAAFLGPGYVLQNIISPLFIAKILGQLATHHSVNGHYIWFATASLLGGASLSYCADRYFLTRLSAAAIRDLYDRCLSVLLRQDYSFFANSFSGSLVTRANHFAKGYELFHLTFFLDIYGMLCGVLTALGIMIAYNAALGISVAVLWLAATGVVVFLVRRRMPVRRRAVEKESQLTGELADLITNVVTIKTFAHGTTDVQRYADINRERSERFLHSWRMAIGNMFVVQLMCVGLQILVLTGGVIGIRHGSLTVATFLLFQVYIMRIIDSVNKATLATRQFEGAFGDAAEMTELFERTPTVLDPQSPEASRITAGKLQFENMQFAYEGQDVQNRVLLRHFDLTVQAGEKVGLVGPSGSGKTTLTKLLLRFMDVQGGRISIDGQDIRKITQDDLHTAISYVPQEPLLFHRTIEENIAYGSPDASKAAIIRAAEAAHAHAFISSLPHGYDTLVGERGVKLSGGQRQRIAIARAMLKKTPILVLDEATSALDSESEAYIQDGLWKLMEHKTAIVIAHRLSTIQHMDRIVVLDSGAIVEEGTHAQLLKRKGLYAKLWAHQSGGFIEE